MEDPSHRFFLPLRIAVLNEEGQSAHEPLMHDIDQPAEAMVTGIRASGAAISPRPTTSRRVESALRQTSILRCPRRHGPAGRQCYD